MRQSTSRQRLCQIVATTMAKNFRYRSIGDSSMMEGATWLSSDTSMHFNVHLKEVKDEKNRNRIACSHSCDGHGVCSGKGREGSHGQKDAEDFSGVLATGGTDCEGRPTLAVRSLPWRDTPNNLNDFTHAATDIQPETPSYPSNKKPPLRGGCCLKLVPEIGIEPTTSSLRMIY